MYNLKIKDELVFEKASILAIDCTIGLLLLLSKQSNKQVIGSVQSGICCCNLILHYLTVGPLAEERKQAFREYLFKENEKEHKEYQDIIERIGKARDSLQELHNQGHQEYIDNSKIKETIEAFKIIIPSFWVNSIDAVMRERALIWDEIANWL